jgi:phage tail sheath protein FI
MPVTPTYPGVYVEEIPSGVHTITGVATSIAAFVDTFERGPVNYAVQLLSMTDFENYMGGLDTTSEASYAIQQFFLNGGSQCYAVRVTGPLAKAATLDVPDSSAGVVFTATAGQMIGTRTLDNKGAWGNNLRLQVDYNTSDPTTLFNVTISEVDTSGNVLRSEVYRNLDKTQGDAAYMIDVINDGSSMVYVVAGASTKLPEATGTTSAVLPVAPVIPPDGSTCKVKTGAVTKTCTLALNGGAPTDYPGLAAYLEAAIRSADPSNPLLTGATVQVLGAGTSANPYFFSVLAGTGGPSFDPSVKLIFSDSGVAPDVLATDLKLAAGTTNAQQYTFANGKDDTKITDLAIRGLEASKTGFYALDDVDLFNILCIPAATTGTPLSLSASQVQGIVAEAEVYCDNHRAMFIVDIPANVKDLPGMQTWMTQNNSLRNINAAVYFPRIRIPDPLNNGRLRDVGPSGTIAGLWAATDVNRGVWKAPAGVDVQLLNVPQLVYNLVDRENGVLNPLGINCLRSFPVYGNISWGARTLYGADVQASDWKYIPVRRLALYLEESLFRGTKWVVFEPNDEPLWAQIRLNVGSFMHDLFRQGAFQGKTPSQAYLVKCDSEINTQTEIDQGIVNILVGFAPLKPAEFVILQIQQLTAQTGS